MMVAEPKSMLQVRVDGYTRRLVERALGVTRGNMLAASELLGVHRNTMTRLVDRLGVTVGDTREAGRYRGCKRGAGRKVEVTA
jgi:DNA-binding NtrC family response regulator